MTSTGTAISPPADVYTVVPIGGGAVSPPAPTLNGHRHFSARRRVVYQLHLDESNRASDEVIAVLLLQDASCSAIPGVRQFMILSSSPDCPSLPSPGPHALLTFL
ncbi:hypothetical protein EYF80_024884 [Liparis tanakae]|uniref:Uncharacterized protein n=1 Tax=Liparis tanakae TaxID=230148 RepID=A0A4Z2HGN8_9TELE|nr:hypothetical protein EYF80_024884 [Liparis tanakae]